MTQRLRAALLACLIYEFIFGFGSTQSSRADEPARDENSDLSFIPAQLGTPAPRGESDPSTFFGKAYLEDALTLWSSRNSLLVPTPVSQPTIQNRLSLDVHYTWQPKDTLKLGLSDRINFFSGDSIAFPSQASTRNDFREAFASYEFLPRTFVEVGRINLKNGVALGYNPTDFFKTRAQVNLASIDPSTLKENRLGVFMINGQKIWDHGALSLAFSPKTQTSSPLLSSAPWSFDPLFGQTNAENRFLVTFSYDIQELNPQVLFYADPVGSHFGLNLSRVIGRSFVFYTEWSGAQETKLTARAVDFTQNLGTLPSTAPLIPQSDINPSFQNNAAVGLSWTSSFKLTANVEYHFHQSGFTASDFGQWINTGSSNSIAANELWYVRQYAADQQEPLIQHELFVRLDWPDWLISQLNLGAIAFVSPFDSSILTQFSGQYFVSKRWTVGAYLGGTVGGPDTVHGSIPWVGNSVLQVVRYF